MAVAALVAFTVRTPLKVVLVDHWRHRWLPRSRLAARIAAVELVILVLPALAAVDLAGWAWCVPMAIAAPLVGVELWFDMRSRGRRLLPELSGSVGIAAVAASVALAGGADARLAVALWLVLAARSLAAIPFVRAQIARLHHGSGSTAGSDRAQFAGAVVAITAVAVYPAVAAGALAVTALLVAQVLWVRRPPVQPRSSACVSSYSVSPSSRPLRSGCSPDAQAADSPEPNGLPRLLVSTRTTVAERRWTRVRAMLYISSDGARLPSRLPASS